jgi:hypothetical protein
MIARYWPPSELLHCSPLLSTEAEDRFEQIRDAFVEHIKPSNIIEHMYVEDISTMSWEIRRLRRCRTAIISLAFRQALERLLPELLRQPGEYVHQHQDEAQKLAYQWFSDPKARQRVGELLEQFHLNNAAIEAEAMRNSAVELEQVDKMLASLESRRTRALRFIAEYRADLADRLRTSSDRIVDGKVLAVEHAKDRKPPAAA